MKKLAAVVGAMAFALMLIVGGVTPASAAPAALAPTQQWWCTWLPWLFCSPPDPTPTTTPTTTTTTTPTTTTTSSTPPPGTCPTTSAALHNWGSPVASEDFNVKPSAASGWDVYNGPGHAGNGTRTPNAVSASGGIMTIIGSPNGDSGGMAWTNGRSLRGRWEVCMKTAAGSLNYHPVMLLWASSGGGVQATNGEVDFSETANSASRQLVNFFLHWNQPTGSGRTSGSVTIDATQWHAWAVEWTATAIVGYVDGREWFRDSDPTHFPTIAAGMTLQLDDLGGDISQGGRMDFDWARRYN